MMRNAILVHGVCDKEEYFSEEFPSLSNSHWFPWLQKQLLINNIFTQTPEMPTPYNPKYLEWKLEFEKFDTNEKTILVGHSCGAGFLVRWLSENNAIIEKLVLVAPWMDPNKVLEEQFFDFSIDQDLTQRIDEIHLFISNNDDKDVLETTRIIKNSLDKIIMHEFEDKGHFTSEDLQSNKLPELLDII